jgi:hypothetical protein
MKGYMTIKRIGIHSGVSLAIMLGLLAGCQTSPKDGRSAGRALDDKNITSSVEKSLKSDPTYKFESVGISTFAGMVQLSGFVDTNDQKTRAESIARNTEGVKEVANGIQLKPANLEPTGRTNASPQIYSEPQNPVPQSAPAKEPTPGSEPK